MPATSIRPTLWMIIGSVMFTSMAAFTHALGMRCDWLLIALVRVLVMLSVAVSMALAKGVPLRVLRPRSLWVRSLAGSVSLVCNFYAMTQLPVADALTLSNLYPLWIVLLTSLGLRRLPGLLDLIGVSCGILGVVLIERPDLGGVRFASGVALIGSASTAVAMLGLHQLRGTDPRAVIAHFAGVASLVAIVWLLARGGSVPNLMPPDLLAWALLGGVAISGTVGQFFLTKAFASGPPTRMAIVGLSQVAFAMILDVLIWGRSFTPASALGIVLVLAPTTWLAGRARRRLAEVPESDPEDLAGDLDDSVPRLDRPASLRIAERRHAG